MELGTSINTRGVYTMKLELDRNDVVILTSILEEVQVEWKRKTTEMIRDKNCSAEIYEEHIDSANKLDTIVKEIKEQL